jgi:thymidylate synthase
MLSNIQLFKSDDIDELNEKLWRTIYNKGNELKFGGIEEVKDAREIFAVIQLYGKALTDLYDGKLPKRWKFGEAANKVYIEMLKNPDKGEQPYTYGERLHRYPIGVRVTTIVGIEGEGENVRPVIGEPTDSIFEQNQMWEAHDQLKYYIKAGLQSNQICGVIWIPSDRHLEHPPCFNWFQLRLSDGNKVSLRILFRSHDYGNACFANWGAIIRCFVDEVIEPAGGDLEELICVSASGHIYKNDFDMVEALIGKVPDHIRRLL